MRIFNVLNLGAGWQSSRILLGSELGELPTFDATVFADTQWEPKAVYEHLQWLKTFCKKNTITTVSAGDLRADSIEFRANRRSSDGKRLASIPAFTKNTNGTTGRTKRQCTKEYKIEPIEKWIRRELLGMQPRQRIPKDVLVRQWYGISSDEMQRCHFPGRAKKKIIQIGTSLMDEPIEKEVKVWYPVPWKQNVYCLLNEMWTPDKKIVEEKYFPRRQSREDVGQWLRQNFTDREIPRSACIGCPNRTNEEWKRLLSEEFRDAAQFDKDHRNEDGKNAFRKGKLVSELYLHRQLVPLEMVDLRGPGEKTGGGGCGTLFDGEGGYCDS